MVHRVWEEVKGVSIHVQQKITSEALKGQKSNFQPFRVSEAILISLMSAPRLLKWGDLKWFQYLWS
jgi:hypothetical protein